MRINMPAVELSRDLIPEDRYNFSVVETRVGVSPKGKEFIEWKMKVLDGEHEGRIVFQQFYEAAMWRLKQLLTDMEAPDTFLNYVGDGKDYHKQFQGLKFNAYVEHKSLPDSDKKLADIKHARPLQKPKKNSGGTFN